MQQLKLSALLACATAAALLAGCTSGPSHPAALVVPTLDWPTRQTNGVNLNDGALAVEAAARPLMGTVRAVKLLFDGVTPAGRIVMALAGRPGAGDFFVLRRPPGQASFHLDQAIDGRNVVAVRVLGVRYNLGPQRSFILAIAQPTCSEISLSGVGVVSRRLAGFDGVFELSTSVAYSKVAADLTGRQPQIERLITVTA